MIAADGMLLTDGASYGRIVFLGKNDSIDRWKEIPESDMVNDVSINEEYNTKENYEESIY